ncbi:MAG TPA: Fur family transcriptional regulator [Solirubrobacteraceae bacterium]|nr:Fur family transcriptional regulator [Solirubrobacteraceae bacterium]
MSSARSADSSVRPSTGAARPSAGAARRAPGSDASGRGSWAERAEAALAAQGRKRGGARRALLELLEGQSCALTAPEIEAALGAGGRRVSRASVYRILDELERLRLVARVETGQAMVRYERAHDSAGEHHHHLVCDSCGLVMPFADEDLERAIRALSERVPLAVSEHEIVLHGACRACAS